MATYNFNVDTKIIQLTDTGPLDMQDLYSRWKDEVLATISGGDQALRVVKEPLSGSNFVGPFYFTMNDWQIRPQDIAHELIVIGTVVQDATSTASSFKVDNLTSVVSIVREIAVSVQSVETGVSGLTPTESAQLTAIETNTNRVDGLIENSVGDRFTSKALEQSPSGGGGGLDEQSLHDALDSYANKDNYKANLDGIANSNEVTLVGNEVAAVRAKTDNLPADPASETSLAGKALEATAQSIKLKTDLIPADPATESTVATKASQASVDALNDFNPATDTVQNVNTVQTTVTNNDMRGTDGANTTTPDNTGIAAIKAKTDALPADPASNTQVATRASQASVDGLNDISLAEVNAQVDQALTDYDGPTKAELDTAEANIIAEVNTNESKIDTAISNTNNIPDQVWKANLPLP
jgi:hypothetical protein